MQFGNTSRFQCHIRKAPKVAIRRFDDQDLDFRTFDIDFENDVHLTIFVTDASWDAFKQAVADAFIADSMNDVNARVTSFSFVKVADEERCCDGCCKSGSF